MLREALGAPGVRYACAADPATGQVVAAHGTAATGEPPPAADDLPDPSAAAPGGGAVPGGGGAVPGGVAAVLGWAGAEAAATDTGARFEDAVITTDRAYHLVRTLHRDNAALLAYLQVDRVRGNLALARRALLTLPSEPIAVPNAEPIAVPAQTAAPEAERIDPVAIPLPRRASTAAVEPPPPSPPVSTASEPPDRPGSRWSDDLRTMARILAGLRRLDRPSTTES
ncbi:MULTISPECIES: hypothetical protein [Pseudonocardia]|uniref:DUF305 domain-containing protein n=1 Tax=Pseudonocardia saturnea TaxID=33909 RepID=A0ABQ0S4I1_9PSEU|nr:MULTISPECIES: hypothetical protein [Pseudonocardia]BBF98893.1 hypothetical protein Pdca_01030 [Pseudonocardia autotrophica]GEC27827.1 hypothetical protein PSA01_48560 [Pseudonocardia saturnea]